MKYQVTLGKNGRIKVVTRPNRHSSERPVQVVREGQGATKEAFTEIFGEIVEKRKAARGIE